MTKFEGDAGSAGRTECRDAEEGVEEGGVGLEVRRKLEEHDAKFVCLADGFECGDELGYIRIAFAEAFEVGDALRRFEAEVKVGRSGGEPAFEHLRGGQSAEGIVHLDRGKLRGVELEEFFRGSARRIELGFPGWISPAGGPGMDAS